ncbi:MAG: HAD family phosphatase [Flavobacteriales bacterium]|jgi:putative hydrolase of the HAD superfamily|nr:HAD family phosphatase [Flavobacteriales bacterium]
MKNSKAIIFDLGAVILNINYQNTIDAFIKLEVKNASTFYSKKVQTDLFNQIETGKITAEKFLTELQRETKNATIKQVTDAWNAMLLDLPEDRLELIKALKKEYRIYLLSNTNEIHIDAIKEQLGDKKWNGFSNLFDKMYLSHEVGMRKPNTEVFEHILVEQKLKAEEVFFIDDSPQHIEGAKKLGIKTHHLLDNKDITSLFPDIIL